MVTIRIKATVSPATRIFTVSQLFPYSSPRCTLTLLAWCSTSRVQQRQQQLSTGCRRAAAAHPQPAQQYSPAATPSTFRTASQTSSSSSSCCCCCRRGSMRWLLPAHAPAWHQLLGCAQWQQQQQRLCAAHRRVLSGALLQWYLAHTNSQPPLDHQQHQQHHQHEQQQHEQRQHEQQPTPEVQSTPEQQQQQQQRQRLLSVAVVGLPNAGKSTLVNRLAGTKISGVSSKRNTTISPQLGAFTDGDTQVLLYDTPGLVEQVVRTSPLERLRAAWATAAAADQVLFIVDAERQFRLREPALLSLAQQLASGPPQAMLQGWRLPPCLLFLNKRDKLPPVTRATVMQQLQRQLAATQLQFAAVFEGAAMRGEGVAELRQYLVQQAKPGAWVMPPGQQHAATPGELAVELVREKLYRRLNQELPYRLGVTCEAVRPAAAGAPPGLYIRVAVTVRTRLLKSVVIGRGGSVIQQYVCEPTRAELERVLGTPVNLSVRVQALTDR